MGFSTLPLTAAGTALLKQNELANKVLLKAEAEWRAKHPNDTDTNTNDATNTTDSTTNSDSSDSASGTTTTDAAVDNVANEMQQSECTVA